MIRTRLSSRYLFAFALCIWSGLVLSQVDDNWKSKAKLVIDTTAQGAALKGALQQFVLPIRLHTGNFDFKLSKSDGSDLRLVAADGKTVLPHVIESWDATNELATLWVQVPSIAPGTKDQFIWLYAANPNAAQLAPAQIYDAKIPLALHFSGALANAASGAVTLGAEGTSVEAQGVTGQAMKIAAGGRLLASGPGLKLSADGTTLSSWIRIGAAGQNGSVLKLSGPSANIEVLLAAGVPALRAAATAPVAAPSVAGRTNKAVAAPALAEAKATAPLTPARWQHLAVVLGERVALFVDSQEVASLPVKTTEQALQLVFGAGAAFDIDELTVGNVARGPDYLRAIIASQGEDNKLIGPESEAAGSEANYLKILIDNLTIDGKIVIYILLVMFVIAVFVIVGKFITLAKIGRLNAAFLEAFRKAGDDAFIEAGFGAKSAGAAAVQSRFAESSLFRMFDVASGELRKRIKGEPGSATAKIDDKAMNSIRAAIDAVGVRENNRLNRFIVLLTIAISGGPFIGLLGTVVGVMITFAAIAAAGDVNINSIAPGIAAALLATVAGLAVAIPALFAYNWLASRIKEISSEMQIFGDELISRLAEGFEK